MGRGMDAERQGRAGEGIFQEKQKVEGGNDVYTWKGIRKSEFQGQGRVPLVLELPESCFSLTGLAGKKDPRCLPVRLPWCWDYKYPLPLKTGD